MAMSKSQAEKLLKQGLIKQETFDKIPEDKMSVADETKPIEPSKEPMQTKSSDPTQVARDVVKSVIKAVIPSNSPLAMSNPAPVKSQVQPEMVNTAAPAVTDTVNVEELAQPEVQPNAAQMQRMQGQNLVNQAYDMQQSALIKGAAAGAESAMKIASEQETLAKLQEQRALNNEKNQMEREKLYQTKLDDLNSKLETLNKEGVVDQDRYWKNKSTGQKITTGIGLFLGAFGARNGVNPAVSVVQNAIDQDIKAQMADLNNKKTGLEQQRSLVGQLAQSYKSMAEIENAAKVAAYTNAQLKLEAIANKYKSPQILANAEAAFGQLEAKKQEALANFQQAASASVDKEAVAENDPVLAKIMAFPEKKQKQLLEAKEVYDTTEAAKKYIDDAYAKTINIGAIEGNIPFSKAKSDVSTFNAGIESAIRSTMKGQGTIQEAEIERLVKPFLISPIDSKEVMLNKRDQLKKLLETKNSGQINVLRGFGLIPAQKKLQSIKEN